MSELYSSRRIAVNTIMLYIRMIVMMGITFYTTRVLLEYLGVADFGIYNVLMGIITMFAFVSTAMTIVTQRFISFELGSSEKGNVLQVFSASFYIYLLLIVVSILLFETVGLWYVSHYINVPLNRVKETNIVYQLVVFQFIFMTLRIPFNSAVIAFEKMGFYAYLSILEAMLSLGLIYLLLVIDYDRLVTYSFLSSISKVVIFFAYVLYCRRLSSNFTICSLSSIPKKIFIKLWSFLGWNVFSAAATSANINGINIIINYFSGVIVNASVGVSTQLTMGLYNVVGNLQTAFSPQIVKLYAASEFDEFKMLLYRNSRYCYYLFLLIMIPLFVCIHYVLLLWLGKECVYAVEFCRCMLIYLALEALAYPLFIAIQADGKVGLYHIFSGLIFLLLIPIAILVYKLGLNPVMIFMIRVFQNIAFLIVRYFYLKKINHINLDRFCKDVLVKCILVTALSFPIPAIIGNLLDENLVSLGIISMYSIVQTSLIVMLVGMTKSERFAILNIIKSKL